MTATAPSVPSAVAALTLVACRVLFAVCVAAPSRPGGPPLRPGEAELGRDPVPDRLHEAGGDRDERQAGEQLGRRDQPPLDLAADLAVLRMLGDRLLHLARQPVAFMRREQRVELVAALARLLHEH